MQIKTETLEKLQVINFYTEQPLVPDNLPRVAFAGTLPADDLWKNILSLPGVERILAVANMISIRFAADSSPELKMLIMAELDDYTQAPYPLINEFPSITTEACAEALADAFIRPTLNRDGGDIEIQGINDGVIEISFTGHCAGCPYAQNTLQNVIMRTFLRYMPEVKEVKQKVAA